MNKILKSVLSASGIAAGGFVLSYGFSCLSVELLFNRNWVLPKKVNYSVANCDSERLENEVDKNVRWVESYGYENHSIINDSGQKLAGRLLRAEKESDVYVFGVHGYRGNGKRLGGMARHYIEKGYNVFLPDLVASGESEGTYCTVGRQETKDCIKWLHYMTDNFGKDIKIILHGVSLGAAAVMLMCSDESLPQNVKMAVEDSGFSSITKLFRYKIERNTVKSELLIKSVNLATKRRIGFDFYEVNPIESVRQTKVPILFIHGAEDGLVPLFMANELFDACSHKNKEILIIDGANHVQNLMVGGERYFSALDGFIEKNI